jgi:hypothetical protein
MIFTLSHGLKEKFKKKKKHIILEILIVPGSLDNKEGFSVRNTVGIGASFNKGQSHEIFDHWFFSPINPTLAIG